MKATGYITIFDEALETPIDFKMKEFDSFEDLMLWIIEDDFEVRYSNDEGIKLYGSFYDFLIKNELRDLPSITDYFENLKTHPSRKYDANFN